MGLLDGRTALISGAARGMGASHARRLHSEGASVVIGDLLDDDGRAVAEALGERAHYVHLDVTDEESWKRAVQAASDRFGGLDILVNNAGIFRSGAVGVQTAAEWRQIIEVNLTGAYLGLAASVPALTASAHASIVNVSSTAGLRGYPGLPAYTASKWGIRGLTKAAALDLAGFGIRVNSVHPGLVDTPMAADVDKTQGLVAMHRAGRPEEISELVLFLASDLSSYSTGAEFVADGGETAGIAED